MCGYIKLHRKILEWGWYSDINTRVLFFHLLLKASSTNRTYRNIKLKKGQLITSVKLLSEQTGLTTQKVRTCINRLKSTNEITATTNMQYTVITLKKWADYQGFSANEQQTDNKEIANEQQTTNKHLTNEQQTDNKQITTVKEGEFSIKKDNLKVIKKENKKSSSKNKGTRFKAQRDENQNAITPDDFYQYATKQGLSSQDIFNQFQSFADYWESVAGAKGVKLDWLATWRNWLRNSYSSKSITTSNNTTEALKDITNLVNANPLADQRPQSAYNLGD